MALEQLGAKIEIDGGYVMARAGRAEAANQFSEGEDAGGTHRR